ncbi:MAG: carboxyl transferase domain-containing protein [Pseudomonadales bacterium]|nr:carboxyl transferase domain-containing protein [Pseudomonadales bacterium]
MKLLIANRGEIAIRINRSARDLGLETVSVFAEDESNSLHTQVSNETYPLKGSGPSAYLDIPGIVAAALNTGCSAVHPGYGFLSENANFATKLDAAGIQFIGPSAETLALFGDKSRARAQAAATDVPVLAGTTGPSTVAEIEAFFADLAPGSRIIIKALSGGGGRGMRVVNAMGEIAEAYARCQSEALAAFDNDGVYCEEFMPNPRHIEVQIVGDGERIINLGERDCSLQRRHQKILEFAPAPNLSNEIRRKIITAAERLAASVDYQSLGTFEFLLNGKDPGQYAFIEANPRLQVEHTVTEEVTQTDLVAMQLQIAQGITLADQGITRSITPQGLAVQARVNLETINEAGDVIPSGGQLQHFDIPGGPGIRVDTFGYTGYTTSPRYDSLLAKVVVSSRVGDLAALNRKAKRALAEFRITGADTNIGFLQALLSHEDIALGNVATTFIEENVEELVRHSRISNHFATGESETHIAGAQIDANNPLAVLDFGQAQITPSAKVEDTVDTPEGTVPITSPLQGTIVSIETGVGDEVQAGQILAIMESMKMEHEIRAVVGGKVLSVNVAAADAIWEGHTLILLEEGDVSVTQSIEQAKIDLDYIRPDLQESYDRHAKTLDQNRPAAVSKRHGKGLRTARENILDLCDDNTFVEYGSLVIAAQRRRHSIEHLMDMSPADGMVVGVGAINRQDFADPDNRCVVMSYDYTVLAGTQGAQNHRKTDRMIDIASNGKMPMVIFAEGGGGRPGDTDGLGMGSRTFARFATLSGLVPMVGITTGRCFAGNASLLGCCDVIIATKGSNIGMGGPAMIEGGGLGIFAPEDIGPTSVQVASGVIDLLVEDEQEAVAIAQKYLSYFQGATTAYETHDQREMRQIVPENRLRVYAIRDVIETIADVDSVLEIRPEFGHGMITSLVRIEGKPVGVIANNPHHLGGAIDSNAADKGARFMQLCDAFDIPLLYLCDTPGIMVGPEIEHTALVRHSSRMFIVGANLTVPFFTIVIRKAYGLGAIAMAGGSYKTPFFTVSWPTGEFGGMGLEGSVKLGYRKELAAIEDADERLEKYEEMVARAYDVGKAVNNANLFSIDDTIDPADSRWWVASLLSSVRTQPRSGKKRPCVDAW